jgi:hypothetical protein
MINNTSDHTFPDYDCITEREVQLMIQAGLVTEIADDDNGQWLQNIENKFNTANSDLFLESKTN